MHAAHRRPLPGPVRVLAPPVLALLLASVAGAFVVGGRATLPGSAGEGAAATHPAPAGQATGVPGASTVPVAPPTAPGVAPSPSTLAAGLLAFADLGGFYSPQPATSARQLAASRCLSQLAPAGAASTAQTYFAGPARGSLPAINEVVGGYPGTGATTAYARDVAVLRSCAPVTVTVAGATATVHLAALPATLPPGDTEAAFGGRATVGGRTWEVQVAVVEQPQAVLVLVYVDTVPASDAIYGTFPATVAAAVGKLA